MRKYKITMEFEDESDYQYFLDMQKEYPKLRRFCEELENQLRSWRKYDATPEHFTLSDCPEDVKNALAHEIERWYYSVKEEWAHD